MPLPSPEQPYDDTFSQWQWEWEYQDDFQRHYMMPNHLARWDEDRPNRFARACQEEHARRQENIARNLERDRVRLYNEQRQMAQISQNYVASTDPATGFITIGTRSQPVDGYEVHTMSYQGQSLIDQVRPVQEDYNRQQARIDNYLASLEGRPATGTITGAGMREQLAYINRHVYSPLTTEDIYNTFRTHGIFFDQKGEPTEQQLREEAVKDLPDYAL